MTAAARSRAYRRQLTADAAAARAAAALRPRIVTVAEAGAVVRPATAAERERWTAVEFGGAPVAAVRVEANDDR